MMKKFILNSLITAIALGGASVALAESNGAQLDVVGSSSSTLQKQKQAKDLLEKRKEDLKNKEIEARNKLASSSEARKDRIASTTDRIKDRIASSTEKREERIDDRKDKMASTTEKRRERVMQELKKKFDKMLKRIEATITREESILGKINTRIQKIKSSGGNTSASEKLTADAKMQIDAAKTDLATLKTTASVGSQDLSTSTDSVKKETLEKMRATEKSIEKHLKDAHKLLEKALGGLRGLSEIKNPNATTTATTTSSN